ncbi:MAG TPA: biotin-dependent carboxyltransferase family protein [Candidatus Polarisedimenticolia bacterium]|nr:biotin-dependent carboxyltransferase family protein [Candidatus Polarisedimenticolia bacterium]
MSAARRLEVIAPGLQTTVQDRGRPGHARFGVSAAGAADPLAYALANRLAGNEAGAAALEMTLLGATLRFDAEAVVALAGADMRAEIDGLPFPCWQSRRVPAGAVLKCGAAAAGARTYLAVAGGFDLPLFLGSRSTHLPSHLGGLEGRALRRGDRLPLGSAGGHGERTLTRGALERLAPRPTLRVTPGPQAARFTAPARRLFETAEFVVSAASDRMGIRLDGTVVPTPGEGRMPSEGMPLGAVQVPPDGAPILLFVDHQTTGGYPVIASVAAADAWRAGQLRPGARVRFETIDSAAARDLYREQQAWLRSPDLLAPVAADGP